MLILKNGKTVRNEIIDLVINGDIIEDIIIKQSMSDQNYPKEVDAVQDSQEIDSCGGFNTPTLCVVTKGIKADCNHLMRTTYSDALCRGMLISLKIPPLQRCTVSLYAKPEEYQRAPEKHLPLSLR